MPGPIQSKLPNVGTTIFTVMSKMAHDFSAINLSQGFPDFEPAPELLERVTYYLGAGKNQYPPMTGVPELRQAIAQKFADQGGVTVDPETEITITSGATEALLCSIHAVVGPGDEVIVFDPAYDSYEPAVDLAGGTTIHLPLTLPHYRIDWD
ncbi:MAG: aminotransferase class I/II-fold pyridoxal phosphate-dependent enzyme, partial [bacterium]